MSGRLSSKSCASSFSRKPYLLIMFQASLLAAVNLLLFQLDRHTVLSIGSDGFDRISSGIEQDSAHESLFSGQINYFEKESSAGRHELLGRKKRNIFQLGKSFLKNTKYSPLKLANYGNWCGIGGDRRHDGSYVDGCDLCCKKHDKCYHRARTLHSGCNPRLVTYEMGEADETGRSPCYDSPGCAREVCRCDSRFVACMKKEPCSPLKVYENVSYFWWMMPSQDRRR